MSSSALGASQVIQYLPAGSMVDFAGTSAPAGWLMCDGRSLPTASYPDLFAALSYSYGGSGANFNLPDFRGRFARYNDNMGTSQGAAGRDAGRVHGSTQAQATERPTTSFSLTGSAAGANAGPFRFRTPSGFSASADDSNYMVLSSSTPSGLMSPSQTAHTHTVSGSVDGGGDAETRPINISCNRIIKY